MFQSNTLVPVLWKKQSPDDDDDDDDDDTMIINLKDPQYRGTCIYKLCLCYKTCAIVLVLLLEQRNITIKNYTKHFRETNIACGHTQETYWHCPIDYSAA
jgi:hypothetical protein